MSPQPRTTLGSLDDTHKWNSYTIGKDMVQQVRKIRIREERASGYGVSVYYCFCL